MRALKREGLVVNSVVPLVDGIDRFIKDAQMSAKADSAGEYAAFMCPKLQPPPPPASLSAESWAHSSTAQRSEIARSTIRSVCAARAHMDRAAINSVRVSSAAADVVPKWFYSTADRKQIGPVSAAGACDECR